MSPEMAAALQLIAFVTGWIAFALLAAYFLRRYIIRGDVINQANLVLDEVESIETFVDDFLPSVSR